MVGSQLPEPVLSIALDAVENLQGGEDTITALWSVFARIPNAVENGRRLENMSWRLWHCVRAAPRNQVPDLFSVGPPRYSEMLRRPLPSPWNSFSSSSEGTATSDWDRDTAVGEDDDGLLGSGARRKTAISPHLEKTRLDLSSGTRIAETPASHLPSPAPSSHRSHHLDSSHDDTVHARDFPSAPSDSTPHHPPQAHGDAGIDVSYERAQGTSLSGLLHQRANLAPPNADLEGPSPPHESKSPPSFLAHHPVDFTSYDIGRNGPSGSKPFGTEILAAAVTSSSMPVTLPSAASTRRDALSVGRLIADLFPKKKLGGTARNMELEMKSQAQLESGEKLDGKPTSEGQVVVTPRIVEPQPSTPAEGRTWFGGNPSSSASAATSATATPRQAFPTVVVENPTPHPTPPATPSPGISEAPGLTPTPFNRPDRSLEGTWRGTGNGQLATPVSLNGDARPLSSAEPTFVMVEPKLQPAKDLQGLNADVTAYPLQTPLLPAAAITLPDKPNDSPSSHLLTPSSNPHPDMSNSYKSMSAALVPGNEDKKFFLEALHSSSGQESSESPESLAGGSVSPQKPTQLGREGAPQLHSALPHEDEVASSFSAGSPAARPPSVTSSRGEQGRLKGRAGFNVAGGTRRRQGAKKVAVLAKQSVKKEMKVVAKETGEREPKGLGEERITSKGKEKAVEEMPGPSSAGPSSSEKQPVSPTKVQRPPTQHPSATPHKPPQVPRQPPTNSLRKQAQQKPRPSTADATAARAPVGQPPVTRPQPPLYPQLGALGLGHLPTVPQPPKRHVEFTSSEYETTDTDTSSWGSESISGDETGDGEGKTRPARTGGERRSRTSGGTNSNRTRDLEEFQRDAEREAQRARELFQKLPPRSYSNLGQLPRVKSGLSRLFRPDPALFPEGHPYRTSHSSRDLLARNWSAPGPPLTMTAMTKRAGAGTIQTMATADPVVTGVNSLQGEGRGAQQRGYRRRGPPQDQEPETESEDDNPENAIQPSTSVAQRRLAELIGQRSPKPQSSQLAPMTRANSHPEPQAQASESQRVSTTTAVPVLMHQYLLEPAPLQTPHTVRRGIISKELDEELRRNLLWERSQNQVQGRPQRAPGSILPGPWQPPTAARPEESRETQSSASARGPGQRSFATQRTKSWAGDYHASGW